MTYASTPANSAGTIDRRGLLRRAGGIGLIGVAGPVLAGCEILAARDDDRYTVTIAEGKRFEPASLTVPVGSTVVWDNTSSRRHAVSTEPARFERDIGIVLPDGVEPFTSIDLATGQTWNRTLTVPGTYVYACPYHADEGMLGMIVVED
jgi:plastocyanin